MPSIQLHALTLATPDGRDLLTDLDLTFGPLRTGLVGRNGTGKTTLLRAIAGDLAPGSGRVLVDARLGILGQIVRTADTTITGALGIASDLARLERIGTSRPEADDFDRADWTIEARAAQAMASFGLPSLALDRPLSTLSGGQRTRLALAALMIGEPDFLLLDEPTNNLDADGRAAVAELLRNWTGGAIVVSHDRDLLHQVDQIVELTSLGARTYGGNWDDYQARQSLDLAAARHDLKTAERQLADIDRKAQDRAERKARSDARGSKHAARGDAPKIILGGMARHAEATGGAQSRLAVRQRDTATASLNDARSEIEILQPLSVVLEPTGLPAGRTVLELSRLAGGYGDEAIIRDLSMTITGPERVALIGANGSGKSTLLRLATGELAPRAGSVQIITRHALLDQHMALLDPALTIAGNYARLHPTDSLNACRAALARFMFRADAALQRVDELSGGEMLRAGLAVTIGAFSPPQLLILDEPTNHLDIHAIAAVEEGLRAYDGALLVVSHDREFLRAIGITREIALAGP